MTHHLEIIFNIVQILLGLAIMSIAIYFYLNRRPSNEFFKIDSIWYTGMYMLQADHHGEKVYLGTYYDNKEDNAKVSLMLRQYVEKHQLLGFNTDITKLRTVKRENA